MGYPRTYHDMKDLAAIFFVEEPVTIAWTETKWLKNWDVSLVLREGLQALSEQAATPISERKLRQLMAAYVWFIMQRDDDASSLKVIKRLDQFADGRIDLDQLDRFLTRIGDNSPALDVLGSPWTTTYGSRSLFSQVEDALVWVLHGCLPELIGLDGVRNAILSKPQHPGIRSRSGVLLAILHDVLGNPFRPVGMDAGWLTPNVVSLANSIHQERAFDQLPILAEALEGSGCAHAGMLEHCREKGFHVRGCWVVDLIVDDE